MRWWSCEYCDREDPPDGSGHCRGCGSGRAPVVVRTIVCGLPRSGPYDFIEPRPTRRPIRPPRPPEEESR